MKIIVYTCVTNNYDSIRPIFNHELNIRYICFSDRPILAPGWEVKIIPPLKMKADEINRIYKLKPHQFLDDCDASLYVDGNIQPIGDLTALIESSLENHNIAMYEHSIRSCLFEEAAIIGNLGYAWKFQIEKQIRKYVDAGMPSNFGLYECNVIFRMHNRFEVIKLMDDWFHEYIKNIRRDQISLPFLLWKSGVKINNIGESDPRFQQKYFKMHQGHIKQAPLKRRMVGFINRKIF